MAKYVCVYVVHSKTNFVARARITSQQMIACFFGKTGHVEIFSLKQHKTVNILSGMQPFVCHLSSKKSGQATCEDGSLFTTTTRALTYRLKQLDLMSPPPSSPDWASTDFFLFPYVKYKLRDQRFSTPEKPVDALRKHVVEIPQSEWQ